MDKRSPQDIDRHIGQRIVEARDLRGFSQSRLAEVLGISFQQVQKYERGKNRISAGRLWLVAKTLDIPVQWFFETSPSCYQKGHGKDDFTT